MLGRLGVDVDELNENGTEIVEVGVVDVDRVDLWVVNKLPE